MWDEPHDVALFVPNHVTLKRMNELLTELYDSLIYVDYATLEFKEDGLYCEAKTPDVNIEEIVDEIGNGDVIVDWDTMSDWEVAEEEEDE